MRLTSDYHTVLAVFNTPVEYSGGPKRTNYSYETHFEVGPLKYLLTIRRDTVRGLKFTVQFYLDKIRIPDDESIVEAISKLLGEEVTINEAYVLYRKMENHPYGIYNLKNVGFRVLSSAIQAIQTFFSHEPYECISFTSEHQSRTDLYRRMIRRFFPGHRVTEEYEDYGGHSTVLFDICKTEPSS
jgi:hypothetical protein